MQISSVAQPIEQAEPRWWFNCLALVFNTAAVVLLEALCQRNTEPRVDFFARCGVRELRVPSSDKASDNAFFLGVLGRSVTNRRGYDTVPCVQRDSGSFLVLFCVLAPREAARMRPAEEA